jgi:hypothetical protein
MTYAGPRTVLEVDLGRESAVRRDLDDAVFAASLGGVGLAVWLLEALIDGPIDPLGPANPLVFAAGPFASTPVPAANKHAVATISPLTGLLNEGLSSSHWSAVLRRCGLAAIVVRGTARRWTTLVIEGSGVRFEDASPLLGASARETTKRLRESLGDRTARVCAIGPAGERRLRDARQRRPPSRPRRQRCGDGCEAAQGDRRARPRRRAHRRRVTHRRDRGDIARARRRPGHREVSRDRHRGESARARAHGTIADTQFSRGDVRGGRVGDAGARTRIAR